MNRVRLALAAALLLVGCGRDGAAEKDRAALDRAAGESAPEAADVLRNAELQAAGNRQDPAEDEGQ